MNQFMFLKNIAQCPTGKTGNPPHLHSLLEHDTFGTEKTLTDPDQVPSRFVEQIPSPEQRVLGIAALLGMEVSVHETARVAETSPYETAMILARAVTLGIMIKRRNDCISFVHNRVRDVVLSSLDPGECLAAHARAAQLLTGTTPERVLRRAHHAFAAANRSTEDAATAVQLAREAAVALQETGDFEQAAVLLDRAVELHTAAALPGPCAAIVVEHAEAVLACGQLAAARPLFHRAARLAETEEDPFILARAALGLGGVWVREHRLLEEAERVSALQRQALAMLPHDATVLRTRLSIRLAAESAYRGGSVAAVIEGVDIARRTGNARALAEALSLCHHTLLTPEYVTSRLVLANELITVASVARDGMLSLIGLCWRAVDLFLLGDPSAHMALTEVRLRADALRCRSVLFIVQAIEVMLAIRAGRFEQAEHAAAACYALGVEVGDADAVAYYGAHLAAIRVFQGREAAIADATASIAAAPTLTERDHAFSSAAALFALRAGQPAQARATLESLTRDGFQSIIPTSSWLVTMQAIIELAAALNDRQNAQAAYDLLLPYAELPLMASLAIVCFGAVHRPLALAASTCGKIDLAIAHFEAAVTTNERLGHRPAAIQTRAELALTLLQRAGAGDRHRGRTLIQEAISEADALGMTGLIARWQDAQAKIEERNVGEECKFVKISSDPRGGWRVALGGHIATTPDLVGMRYLARLVAEPNREIPALALVVGQGASPLPISGHTVMDAVAVTAVRTRICELRQQQGLSADEQDELDTLTHELTRASGLGRRIRSFADAPERARTAVRKAVKRAIEQVTAANPVVGQHLAGRIETGAVCCYRILGH
ncbi:MAG: hypothetical protein AB7P69_03985 [Candidatus Binatia bacterium]